MAAISRDIVVNYQDTNGDIQEWTLKYVSPTATDSELAGAVRGIFDSFTRVTITTIQKTETTYIDV